MSKTELTWMLWSDQNNFVGDKIITGYICTFNSMYTAVNKYMVN